MRIHSLLRQLTQDVIFGFIGLAAMSLIAAGCANGSKIAQSSKGSVYLEEVPDWSFEASHPAVIDQVTMAKALRGLYTDSFQGGSSQMSAGGGKPMRIFSDEDVDFLSPLLTHALSRAKPEQLVSFRTSSSAGSGSEPAAGTIYLQKGALHVTLAQGRPVKGFMPESVARIEQAPAYAAAGGKGYMAAVIDYQALAIAPAVAPLPVAQAAPKTVPASVQAATPQTKPQPVASLDVEESKDSSSVTQEQYELKKTKDALAKKDTEIKMLRREAEWMKRELRERDLEIKAIKASKVSAKPATKKKTAEATQTR
ncbi:MAG TPA: hypothetical protein VEI50_13610 [Nitrospiraceae bacterium]|nr:hypothetical protein [Nitrospiraceae bacterium]